MNINNHLNETNVAISLRISTQLEMDLMISDNYWYEKGGIRYDLSENHAMFTLLRATF